MFEPTKVQSVVERYDFTRRHSFLYQIHSHCISISDYCVRQLVCAPFDKTLRGSTNTPSVSPRRQSYRYGSQCGRSHAKNIHVIVVGVNNIDLSIPHERRQPSHLQDRIAIVKTG
jgi:hypothetical protein